ncbi:MAG: cyclodeaminase/cyclohydrolase family protein [Phycisphaerales bacterium]|nr:cyclodeaminase/cyclohydrolase family protein [Phycisphaerales bacterium]
MQSLSVESLLHQLADRCPVPGGGAAAGMTAAIGLATARMVLAYSIGRKDLADFEASNAEAAAELEAWRDEAVELAASDAAAFQVLSALWKLPEDDPHRIAEWHGAVLAAIAPPLATCRMCRSACELLATLPDRTNPMLASDLAVAAILLHAACAAAAWNVRINLPSLDDENERARLAGEAADDVECCRNLAAEIEAACDT